MDKGKKLSYILMGVGVLIGLALLGWGLYYYYRFPPMGQLSGISYKGHIVGLEPMYGRERIVIPSAKVEIMTLNKKVVTSVVSNQNGDFVFKNTPLGEYILHIQPSQKDAQYYADFFASVGFFKDKTEGKESYFPEAIFLEFRPEFQHDMTAAKDLKYVLGPALILYKAKNGFYPKLNEDSLTNDGSLMKELKNFIKPGYQLPLGVQYKYQSKNNGEGFALMAESKTGYDFYHLLKEINSKKYYILDENYKEVLGL